MKAKYNQICQRITSNTHFEAPGLAQAIDLSVLKQAKI